MPDPNQVAAAQQAAAQTQTEATPAAPAPAETSQVASTAAAAPVQHQESAASSSAEVKPLARGHFAVGDQVHHPRAGSHAVHGVRITAQGEFLQFAADGEWHTAHEATPA